MGVERRTGSIVRGAQARVVAGRADGESLDQSASEEQVEDFPGDGERPKQVAGVGLAFSEDAATEGSTGLNRLVIVELKVSDVGQLGIGQAGEEVVGELKLLCGKEVTGDFVGCRRDILFRGLWRINVS